MEEFNGTYLRIEARVVQSLHGFRIEPRNCRAESNESEAFSPYIALTVVDSETSKLIVARIAASKGKSPDPPHTEIIAIGRFRIVTPSKNSDALTDTLSWQFELNKLEERTVNIQTNPNNKPEGWVIPSSEKILSRKTVELNNSNGSDKVVAVVRDVPPDSRIEIPYYSGRTNFQARVRSVTELSKDGQQPYAYQVIVSEWCEIPANCVPVAWQIVLRDEDGDRIFETYGDTLLPPAWAK